MAQKLFVNNTPYLINGTIGVRAGSQPGQELNSVDFTLQPGPGSQQYVQYGDPNNPYMDSLQLTVIADGGAILSDQVIIDRSSPLDNQFNMNDTIYIAMQGTSFVVTTGNTWTV
jgi:hypothetical protein